MVVKSSGVDGMVTTEQSEKKITIPANDNVLKVGGERVEWILTEVMLEYANALLSEVKRFVDIDVDVSAVLCRMSWRMSRTPEGRCCKVVGHHAE